MEREGFHVCPFCHSPTALGSRQCAHCGRSLEGLRLKVFAWPGPGTASPAPVEGTPALTSESAFDEFRPAPAAAPPAAGPPRPAVGPRSPARRRGLMPVALVAGVLLAGALGWGVVRALAPSPRNSPPATEAAADPANPNVPATPTRPAATAPPPTAPLARHRAPVPPATAAPATEPPAPPRTVAAGGVPRTTLPATPPPGTPHPAAARPGPRTVAAPPGPRPVASPPPPTPAPHPAPQVFTVHPQVVTGGPAERPAPPPSARDALVQLRRSEARRDSLAQRVAQLRERLDSGVITDVDQYQRVQAELDATLDDLDQATADVVRWRRIAGRAE